MSTEQTAEDRCVACGAELQLSCDQVHPQHDCYHPDGHRRPKPTWRDVIRAILPTRPRLYQCTSEGGLRTWQYDTLVKCPSGSHSGILVLHEAREDRWVVRFDGPRQYLALQNPSPADVLTAARLAGLVGLGGDSDER